MAGIDDAVLRRRQRDLDKRTADLQAYFERLAGDKMAGLGQKWQDIESRLTRKVKALYAEMGALDDPARLKVLKKKTDRLEAYISQIRADIVQQTENSVQPYMTQTVGHQLEKSYYMNSWALEQAGKVAAVVPVLTPAQVLGVLVNPWLPDGANYSDRIRANTALLAQHMKEIIEQAVEDGLGWNETALSISKRTGESYFRAVALARTELNRAAALGASYCYMQNNDVLDSKRWNATLDSKTAPKDAANDGKTYEVDYDTPDKPGLPGKRIPNHVHCRCVWSPVLSALGINNRERIARGNGDNPGNFGERIYTKAGTYREYAKERNLPDLDDRVSVDKANRYLRNGEKGVKLDTEIKPWTYAGKTVRVAAPDWVTPPEKIPRFTGPQGGRRQFMREEFKTAQAVPTFEDYKEAEKWAAGNLKTQIGSMKGVQLTHLNETLREIKKIETTLAEGIPARIEFGNVARNAHAHYSPRENTIHLKKLDKDINKSMQEANDRSLRYGKQPFHAVPTKEGTLWHEVAHAIDHKNGWKYANGIHAIPYNERGSAYAVSSYASSDAFMSVDRVYDREAWAENFAAYFANNDRTKYVPEFIVNWIKGVLK